APCHTSRMRAPRRTLAVVLLLALGAWEPFRSPDPDVEAGNRAYEQGRYDDAIAAYDRAEQSGRADKAGIAYDRGTALLKKAEQTTDASAAEALRQRALDDLAKGSKSADPRVRASAQHNRGNALMQQDKFAEAVEAY